MRMAIFLILIINEKFTKKPQDYAILRIGEDAFSQGADYGS